MRNASIVVLAACSLAVAARAQDASLPVKEKEIALPGTGAWDYVTVDPEGGRLYVAHGDRIDVIDAKTNAKVGQVEGIDGAHGIAIVREAKRGFATSGNDDKLVVFDLEKLTVEKRIDTGDLPDAILRVASIGEVWTMNHRGGTITCVDPKSLAVTKTIEVGGVLEAAAEDPEHGRVYVDIEDKGLLAVIDAKQHEVVARHPVAPGEDPAGIAIDRENGLLFLGCTNGKLVVMEAASGKVVTSMDIGEGCDGVAFDPQRHDVFASCHGGSNAIHEKDAHTFEPLGSLDAGKTCALDPQTHKLYVTSGARGEKDSVKVTVYASKRAHEE